MKIQRFLITLLSCVGLFACDLSALTGDGGLLSELTGDGGIISEIVDVVQTCGTVCAKIEQCDVSPPKAKLTLGNTGNGQVDEIFSNDITACATNCAAPNHEKYGYSDCQIACIKGESCGKVDDCWDLSSSAYAKYCKPTIKPIPGVNNQNATGGMMTGGSMNEITIDNNTATGNEDVDRLIEQPAVNNAIVESDTPVNVGDTPPKLAGHYSVMGSIDRASNARPEGSPINTGICFADTEETLTGTYVTYCEDGVPGIGRAPIVGNANKFSVFFEINGAPVTILFSGEISGDDSSVPAAEALVTYTYGLDIWEHSVTGWIPDDPSCTCR